MIVAVVALLIFAIEYQLDVGRSVEYCTQCGARSFVRHVRLFGIGGDYNRQATEGLVSQMIQNHHGKPCRHDWQLHTISYGGLFRRARGHGDSVGRGKFVGNLETFPASKSVLERRAANDPTFIPRLQQTIQDPYINSSAQLVTELMLEMMAEMEGREVEQNSVHKSP